MEEKIKELIKENEALRNINKENEQEHKRQLKLEEYRWALGCLIGVFLAYLTLDLSVLTDFYAVDYPQVVSILLFKVLKAFFISSGCLSFSLLCKIFFNGFNFNLTKKNIVLLLLCLVALFLVATIIIFLKVS